MLTADLVRTRRHAGELRLVPLDEKSRARALLLCDALMAAAVAHVGRSRDEVDDAWDAIEVAPRDRRLMEALRKLIEDRCDFGADEELDPETLRRDLFHRAAEMRRAGDHRLDRVVLVAALAAEHGVSPAAVERGLYADLRGAHRLLSVRPATARTIVDGFQMAQAQAVLLRAVRVTCDVECATAGAYRALFRKLKFLRLLWSIEQGEQGKQARAGERDKPGYHITIDGPYSLFESATKYGLQLALALPALAACDSLSLHADVRWGKEREALVFRFEGRHGDPQAAATEARLPDEVAALRDAVAELGGPWRAAASTKIIDLPGVGLCVPDLEFRRAGRGKPIYLEVMGFWSREAVWRRVELIEKGLQDKILFAVGQHLRVSEQALGEEAPGALYVYKRVMNAKAIIERIERIASR